MAKHPDRARVAWAIALIKFGASAGVVSEPPATSGTADAPSGQYTNNASAVAHASVVRAALAKEVDGGRLAVFDELPIFANGPTIVSPVGVAERRFGGGIPSKFRFTHDLSRSKVNQSIAEKTASIQYIAPFDIARILQHLPPGYVGWVTDIQAAYRHVPMDPADYRRLVFFFEGKFYCETFLPFGLSTGPAIWDQLGDLIQWIVEQRTGINMLRMLDDNFGLAPTTSMAQQSLTIFYGTCAELGVSVQMSKTQLPATLLRFIGFMWDLANRTVGLPEDKLERLRFELRRLDSHTSITRSDLESITGLLNWAGFVVKHGRCFLRRFYDSIRDSGRRRGKQGEVWIRLSAPLRSDLKWWASVVTLAATTVSLSYIVGPHPPDVLYWSDAAPTIGFGAHYGHNYLYGPWRPDIYGKLGFAGVVESVGQPEEHLSLEWSTAFLEMAAAYYGLMTWGHQWAGKSVLVMCDNSATVTCWSHRTSPSPRLMNLIRLYVEAMVAFRIADVRFQWLSTHANFVADRFSRQGWKDFCPASVGFWGLRQRWAVSEETLTRAACC